MKRKTTKPVKVMFADSKISQAYEKLKDSKLKDERDLYDIITDVTKKLKTNPFCGIEIPKDRIPKRYIDKYGVNNLWKYNLTKEWRLIYSNVSDDIQILSVVLEWFDNHKDYEKRFEY